MIPVFLAVFYTSLYTTMSETGKSLLHRHEISPLHGQLYMQPHVYRSCHDGDTFHGDCNHHIHVLVTLEHLKVKDKKLDVTQVCHQIVETAARILSVAESCIISR